MNRRQILLAGDLIKRSLTVERLMHAITFYLQDQDVDGSQLLKTDELESQAPYDIAELKAEILRVCDMVTNAATKVTALTKTAAYHDLIDGSLPIYDGLRSNIDYVSITKTDKISTDATAINLITTKTQLASLSYTFNFDTKHNELFSTCCHDSESDEHRIIRCANIINDFFDVASEQLRIGNSKAAIKRLNQIDLHVGFFSGLKHSVDVSVFEVNMQELADDVDYMSSLKSGYIFDIGAARNQSQLNGIADSINADVPPLVMVRRY